jgi:hypothetical protein
MEHGFPYKVEDTQGYQEEQTCNEPERKEKITVGNQENEKDQDGDVLEIENADGRPTDYIVSEIAPTSKNGTYNAAKQYVE